NIRKEASHRRSHDAPGNRGQIRDQPGTCAPDRKSSQRKAEDLPRRGNHRRRPTPGEHDRNLANSRTTSVTESSRPPVAWITGFVLQRRAVHLIEQQDSTGSILEIRYPFEIVISP